MNVPTLQPHLFQGCHGPVFPGVRINLLDFETVLHVPDHGPVGKQGEMLENHAEAFLPDIPKVVF